MRTQRGKVLISTTVISLVIIVMAVIWHYANMEIKRSIKALEYRLGPGGWSCDRAKSDREEVARFNPDSIRIIADESNIPSDGNYVFLPEINCE